MKRSIRKLLAIWFFWAVILGAYQFQVQARLDLKRPDTVLDWTSSETKADSNFDQPYLMEPFLNSHVAWDSEFYLAIADQGYDAKDVRAVKGILGEGSEHFTMCRADPNIGCYSLSYAFFPVYPILIRLVAYPLKLLSLAPIARFTLAAVIVSHLGALGAMFALYSMTRKTLGEEGGIRAAFYLLIFPSGFFLAQVYSEGVFIGITFAALAFLLARKWLWAAFFSAIAVWIRPGGAILVLPMVIFWIREKTWKENWKTMLTRAIAVISPVLSFVAWSLTPLADRFYMVEGLFFGRSLFAWQISASRWIRVLDTISKANPDTVFYFALEIAAVTIGILTCLALLKERPELALYGLAVIGFALTSGAVQGMVRYVLAVPAIFWGLAKLGKHIVFDRAWTFISILLMGLEALLFTFDFWVA